ncbi:MAG TPA: metal ABC transporter permease [Anaerolineae bacterium]|nr:metal ABC transporter permease [Anaerolineae bacterium]
MLDFLLGPLAFPFMQRALIASVLVGGLCAVIGTYVVLRGMAFLGDALAHAILPGVAISFLLGGDLFLGALIMSIVAALGIGYLTRSGQVREDTAIGIIFSGALALGIVLISSARSYQTDLTHILFGNVLGVSSRDLALTLVFGGAVLMIIALLFKELLVFTFDETFAVTLKLPVGQLRYLLMILLAVTVVVSLQTVGVGLVAAMLVTPAAAASLLTRRMATMMLVSAAIGTASSVIGLYLSYYLNVSTGASIVLVCTAIFILTLIISPRDGLLARYRHTRSVTPR